MKNILYILDTHLRSLNVHMHIRASFFNHCRYISSTEQLYRRGHNMPRGYYHAKYLLGVRWKYDILTISRRVKFNKVPKRQTYVRAIIADEIYFAKVR